MAAESAWWSWPLLAWLSSGTACFLFFNAIVCVVAFLSWERAGGDATLSTRRRRLTRSASSMVMERLRSMSTIFSFHSVDEYDSITPTASQLHHVQGYYCTSQEGGEEMRQTASEVEPELAVPVVESMAAIVALRTPGAPVATAAEVCQAASTSGSEKEEAETWDALEPAPAAAAVSEKPSKWKVAGIVERRAFAEIEEKAEVNARAERFIRQFREDLKLERLNSFLTRTRTS
uniref:Uncharacterized protein n=1 Tax=Avena sativa TaxID=4498 RepID=A0ACD5XYD8_AVESA